MLLVCPTTFANTSVTLNLAGNANVGPVNFFWMGQIGWASACLFLENSGVGLDLVPDELRPGYLKATHSWGCIGAAQWNINSRVFMTTQYSFLRNYVPRYSSHATTSFDNQLRQGYTITANAVWKMTSLFSTGIEYRYANRMNENRTSLGNNRIYAMLMMNF